MSRATNERPDAVDPDVTSDPALDNAESDWASEGGATPEGPATDTDEYDRT